MQFEKYILKNISLEKFSNKNIFITGGNSGIGFSLAKQCAFLGANIFLLCRNETKGSLAKEEILKECPNRKIELIKLDLADFSSIKNAVNEIKKYDVDVFVNNAGVFRLPRSTTKDGIEIVMGTNYFGVLLLNDLLKPYFDNLNHKVKVVFDSSIVTKVTKFNFNDFFLDKKYGNFSIYAKSKLGTNAIYYDYIDENHSNIDLGIAHPGITYTPLINKGYRNKLFQKLAYLFMKTFFHSSNKASLSLLKAINSDERICSYGPRGPFGFSGYPHKWKINPPKNYKKANEFARKTINEKLKTY